MEAVRVSWASFDSSSAPSLKHRSKCSLLAFCPSFTLTIGVKIGFDSSAARKLCALGGEDLEGMSVKELKALLQRRKVDLSGLTDKSELLEAARKLPKERWNAVVAQDGRTYYVNEATNETSWVKPAGM